MKPASATNKTPDFLKRNGSEVLLFSLSHQRLRSKRLINVLLLTISYCVICVMNLFIWLDKLIDKDTISKKLKSNTPTQILSRIMHNFKY